MPGEKFWIAAEDFATSEDAAASQQELAFKKLMRAIATGAIPRGVILKEARLARDLDMGRGALREAISRMEGLNLLKREPNLGVRVFDFAAEIDQILVVREAVEGMACRVAAAMISNQELDLLAQNVESGLARAREGAFETTETDDFHFIIARATRNPRLVHLVCDNIAFQVRLAWHGAITHPGRFVAAAQEHALVLEALAARDPERAEAAMRRHIANSRNYATAVQRHEAEIRADVPIPAAGGSVPELTLVPAKGAASAKKRTTPRGSR